jgi:hypothetical protein
MGVLTLHFARDDSDLAVLVLADPLGGDRLGQERAAHLSLLLNLST